MSRSQHEVDSRPLQRRTWPDEGILACPVCELPLYRRDRNYACENRHIFDTAREGYVNLLLAQHRRSKDPGYSQEMIASRRMFFDSGHYELLADRMAEIMVDHIPSRGGV